MSIKENLDTRICDHIDGAENTETYREFIQESEKAFELAPKDIDTMTEEQLNEYIEWLGYLWCK